MGAILMSKKVQFALFSPQAGQSWHQLEDRTHRCEKLGYHSIWLVDHMWTGGMPHLDHHECITLMGGLAAKNQKNLPAPPIISDPEPKSALPPKELSPTELTRDGPA